jgi:hypothetical protein
MQLKSAKSALWRAALVAAAMVLGSERAAAAGEALVIDGEATAEQLAVVTRQGRPAIRLTLERGRTVWLGITRPLRQLVAGDLDHDGDIDLIATTDGHELVAWFNHGRGRFTTLVINPGPPNPLGPRGSAIEPTRALGQIDFGIGADGALPTAHRPSAPVARLIRLLYSSATRQTLVFAGYGPRAPPAA